MGFWYLQQSPHPQWRLKGSFRNQFCSSFSHVWERKEKAGEGQAVTSTALQGGAWIGAAASQEPPNAGGPGEKSEGLSLTCQERCSRQTCTPLQEGSCYRDTAPPQLSDSDTHLPSSLPQAHLFADPRTQTSNAFHCCIPKGSPHSFINSFIHQIPTAWPTLHCRLCAVFSVDSLFSVHSLPFSML